MATDWSFHGSVGALLERLLPMGAAHAVSAALLGIAILASLRFGGDMLSRMMLAWTAFIVFTPTLFPWYLAGLLPLLALRPDPALLYLAATAILAEEVIVGYRATGAWEPAPWAKLAQYAPFYALLAIEAWKRWGMWRRSDAGYEPGEREAGCGTHDRRPGE
jgi:hypothetical protein